LDLFLAMRRQELASVQRAFGHPHFEGSADAGGKKMREPFS